jgi:putative intracellular protease/amidase
MAFPGVDLIDVYGPIEILYMVAGHNYLNLTIITPTSDSVVINPPMGNPYNSIYKPEIVGSATLEDELDLDVLLVPGGAAARDQSLTYVDDYLIKMAPKVDYLITICTGATFAARAGLLSGRRATTNKRAWDFVTGHGENITWVAPARYVIDGDIWSSSGVCTRLSVMIDEQANDLAAGNGRL